MKLSCRTIIHPTKQQKSILDSYTFAASKLWNVGNYEKHHFKNLGFDTFPNWYDQKKRLKGHHWHKALPSQSAQEVLNVLQQAWKSFFALKKSGGIKNPQPPHYKQGLDCFSILNNGFRQDGPVFQITLSGQQKAFLKEAHTLKVDCLMLEIPRFQQLSVIKQLRFYPLKDGSYAIIAIYEVSDVAPLPDNGHYLAIDLGVNNLAACYDSAGTSFIISGNRYLNACHYYTKEIAKRQSILDKAEPDRKGCSQAMSRLYLKRKNVIDDVLHKATRLIADYCLAQEINTVVIGDITAIRKDKDLGHRNNQTFHGLPFLQFFKKLSYKLAQLGIRLVGQKEYYSSQCPPTSLLVSKRYAKPSNRKKRGLYVDQENIYNADSLGVFNILRLFLHAAKIIHSFAPAGLSNPIRVSV